MTIGSRTAHPTHQAHPVQASARSHREVFDRGDAAQAVRETLQQGETIAAHRCVVGVDHEKVSTYGRRRAKPPVIRPSGTFSPHTGRRKSNRNQ